VRLPTFAELRRFVAVEGWEDRDRAARRKTGDHHRYVFTTPTGERLMTRVSHGAGRIGDPDLFAHILHDQLQVDAGQFWAAVDRGVVPARPQPAVPTPEGPSLDAKLARNLLTKVRVPAAEVAAMTTDEAVRRWQEWLADAPR
jgi:hypothetical protein